MGNRQSPDKLDTLWLLNRQGSHSTPKPKLEFDNAGNWTSTILYGTTQNRTHNVKDQTTVLDGNATTHDARGNLLTFEHNSKDYTITYDVENRITQVDVDNDDVEYRYDAFGRRTIRKEGSDETALLWWGSSECAEYEHTATQPTIQNDIFCDPNRLNAVIARAVDGSKFDLEFYHKNYLDHVYAVSDDNGNLIEHYRYTAYGEQEIYNATGTLITTSAIGNEITWNTKRTDTITGFYMYQYRHYAPQLGKWINRDPIEEDGGLNLYGFLDNSSISSFDYKGLFRINYNNLTDQDVVKFEKALKDVKETCQKTVKNIKAFRRGLEILCAKMMKEMNEGAMLRTADETIKGCCCLVSLGADLKKLQEVLENIIKDIDSSTTPLNVEQLSLSSDTYARIAPFTNRLQLSTNAQGDWRQDGGFSSTLLHELSHLHGTVDELGNRRAENFNPFNNAHVIETFVLSDNIAQNVWVRSKLRKCAKKGGLVWPR